MYSRNRIPPSEEAHRTLAITALASRGLGRGRALGAVLLALLSLSGAGPAEAAGYRIGQLQEATPLEVHPNANCQTFMTWYGPEIFNHPNGEIGFIAQSFRPLAPSCPVGNFIDSFYAARKNDNGTWTEPSSSTCPTLSGTYGRCGHNASKNTGPLGRRSIVKIGNTYYMAFSGGNADFFDGKIYWATSSDAVSWVVYSDAGGNWLPILGNRYHDCDCGGIDVPALAFDPGDTSTGPNGTFYIYFTNYRHHAPNPDESIGCLQLNGPLDTWGYRFEFNPSQPFGLGNTRQIWHREGSQAGAWKTTSGELVWNYDVVAGLPALRGEPVLKTYHGQNPGAHFRFGAGNLKKDPISGKWLHVWSFSGETFYQTADSLAANVWTNKVLIDRSVITNSYPDPNQGPSGRPVHYMPGIHYGERDNRTGWWLYTSVNHLECSTPFIGLGIVSAELCSDAAPTITSVSPASGSAGTSVTIRGSRLDCASAVTFGGVPATITKREPGKVTVLTPSHGGGSVSVTVTTPAGSRTRGNGFTYSSQGLCSQDNRTLCLNRDRFAVTVDWAVPGGGSGPATTVPHNSDTGFFWFFSPANLELAVKVLDGTAINGNYWVFFGGLTDVAYTVTVRDTQTGQQRNYYSPAGDLCGGRYTDAFPHGGGSLVSGTVQGSSFSGALIPVELPLTPVASSMATGSCAPSATSLCVLGNRFRIEVDWRDFDNQVGVGKSVPLTDETGSFWFFSPTNLELLVKMLDGTSHNGKYWMFLGSLSDVQFTVKVTDTTNGKVNAYFNPLGAYCGQSDLSAFP